MTSIDITKPLLRGNFNIENMTYELKLGFHTNNTSEMKEFIHKTRFLRIRAKDLVFVSKDKLKGWDCRGWEFLIEFDFLTLEIVKQNFEPGFQACNPEDFININENQGRILSDEVFDSKYRPLKKENIILREIFFVSVIAFIFNIMLTMQIITTTIDVVRYRKLKSQKNKMYRWLLREQKNFDIYVNFF